MTKKRITIDLPMTLVERIKVESKKEDRTIKKEIERAIRNAFLKP